MRIFLRTRARPCFHDVQFVPFTSATVYAPYLHRFRNPVGILARYSGRILSLCQLRSSIYLRVRRKQKFYEAGHSSEIHGDENEKARAKRKSRTRFGGEESPGNEALTSSRISRSNTNVYRDTTATSAQIISVINGTGCYAIASTKTACPDRFPSLVIASSRLI